MPNLNDLAEAAFPHARDIALLAMEHAELHTRL
jgi:hypothetical protein